MGAFSLLITTPLGYIISFIYDLVQNYGLAIIIFTILVKFIMLPLVVKQQKSTVQMKMVQPELQKIQKKYANDQQRLSQETMKLYKKYNISPAGGCLPLLIQLPIILGLYQVITRPMQYILHMGTDLIQKIANVLKDGGFITEQIANYATKQNQITVASAMADNLAFVEEKVGTALSTINFDFFGLDLSLTPQLSNPSILWIIPILSAVTAYLSGKITTKLSGNDQAAEQMKTMNIMMPLMSGYFCFIMPTGVGLYWVMSNVIQVIQQVVVTKIMLKKEENTIS
ncbi:MAG: YidC/Oxa1 family membrane protein insertase [Clostridia bacterium]|nr:YidC/Oxa1 family membrane protein insertase [Clostridia bacterium]